MTLIIDGVHIEKYVAFGGIAWQRADVDGKNAGRTAAATMKRDRLAIKYRLDVTCRPLTLAEASTVLKLIEPEYITVTYTDPSAGKDVTRNMYSNNIPAQFMMKRRDGQELWGGITFPLIET
ncbi:MAG: hypothetical protein RR365_14985 [Bacteroides sp.]